MFTNQSYIEVSNLYLIEASIIRKNYLTWFSDYYLFVLNILHFPLKISE